jgi:hypothetical protein
LYKPERSAMDGDATARRLKAMNRIRKLLRLAEDQAGQPEGEAAGALAAALMAEHQLHRGTIELGAKGEVDFRHRGFDLGAAEPWRRTLVDAIAEYFDCVALYEKGSNSVETYGPEHALPQVEYTFVVYMRQLQQVWRAHAEALREEGLWAGLPKVRQLEAREGFCVSFVLGVKERLDQDRKAELKGDPSAVGATKRQRQELERWMRGAGVRWRAKTTDVGTFSAEGFEAGKLAQIEPGLAGRGPTRRIEG